MRGEESTTHKWLRTAVGSPPHARGRAVCRSGVVALGGITPACAGKSSRDLPHLHGGGDHPRMRGEEPQA